MSLLKTYTKPSHRLDEIFFGGKVDVPEAGNFIVPGQGIFYSNGVNAFCRIANMDHYRLVGGTVALSALPTRNQLPVTFANHGQCGTAITGLRFSSSGAIPGMICTQFNEPSDPHSWHDNFLCWPASRNYGLRFSSSGPIPGQHCLQLHEGADIQGTWHDNYLCSSYDMGIRWSSAGRIPGRTCTQIYEPAEPAHTTWTDNFLCY